MPMRLILNGNAVMTYLIQKAFYTPRIIYLLFTCFGGTKHIFHVTLNIIQTTFLIEPDK